MHSQNPTILASFIVMILLQCSVNSAQTCYFPDQRTIATDYTPCNISAIEHQGGTTCCGGGASCLTDGLCYWTHDMSINVGACTDRTWSSSGCFQGCPSGKFPDKLSRSFSSSYPNETYRIGADLVNYMLRLRN